MALEPEAIDLDGLPRTIGGGLKREPVEELLKRVQWEYSQLYYEHKRLKDELEQRGSAESALRDDGSPPASRLREPPVAPGRTRRDRPDATTRPSSHASKSRCPRSSAPSAAAEPRELVPAAPPIAPPVLTNRSSRRRARSSTILPDWCSPRCIGPRWSFVSRLAVTAS